MQKIIVPADGAVTTSGSYRKYFQSGGKKVSHIIDGRTGFPVSNELISVTVWAPNAITADAYDNALMVMGLEQSLAIPAAASGTGRLFHLQEKRWTDRRHCQYIFR